MSQPLPPYRPISTDVLTELFRNPLDPGYADAARRRAATGPRPPRWRLGLRVGTALALVAIGLLLAVAYRQVVAEEPTRAKVRADLVAEIHDREAVTDDLARQAEALRDEVDTLRDRALADPQQARRLRELAAASGLGRVTGDGAVVRVDDGPPGIDPTSGEEMLLPEARILDRDLQRITNTLWASGAEAVAINDLRLTATSTIRSASGAILVDRQPVAGPYEIAAIGPDDLAERFVRSETGQLMDLLVDQFGIGYQVNPERDLTLPAAVAPKLRHATLAEPKGDS